ncbi:MAG TPA: efflux RND transporter permease subunit, partial [Pseudomonadales bacterium]|nr:efflux RND transporter permease subunit [Pseudomonadales bacterium]
ITDLDGKGQATGGIVIMRQGESAMRVAQAAQKKLQQLESSLPAGIKVTTVYDRSKLIGRAVSGLQDRLVEEAVAVFIVSLLLLWSWRSAVSAVLVLPVGIFCAGLVFYLQKLEINIMSLGGIAIAVAAMMDASVVMVEHVNQRLSSQQKNTRSQAIDIIGKACSEVGPALFISLLLITLSFLPVLMLGGREGKLFSPLAWTKTWTMAIACLLSVTLTPALLAIFMRQAQSEDSHRFIRFCQKTYRNALNVSIKQAKKILIASAILLLSALIPLLRTGGEFMPPLDEGDFLYMPVTLPSLSSREAAKLLQETDEIIKSVPEVDHVFGKAGRSGTATDPAPLSMFETVVTLKPRTEWRSGESTKSLLETLQQKLQIPGLLSSWGYPIRTRIGMLSTGVKTPLGLKVTGIDWTNTEQLAADIATQLSALPETRSAVSSRSDEGMYLDIKLRREQAAALGVTARDVEQFSSLITGSERVDYLITDKTERYGITLRLRPDLREDLEAIRQLPIATAKGSVPLDTVATVTLRKGPAEIRSEGGRPVAYVYIEVKDMTESEFVQLANPKLQSMTLPAKTSLEWVGEYREFEQAKARLLWIAPIVLLVVMMLLYNIFRELRRVFLIVLSLPFSLIGGLWLVYLLGFHFSIAVAIGFIALAGLAVEFGVIMVLYLDSTVDERLQHANACSESDWLA